MVLIPRCLGYLWYTCYFIGVVWINLICRIIISNLLAQEGLYDFFDDVPSSFDSMNTKELFFFTEKE